MKKSLAVLLIIVMLAFLAVGCGSSETGDSGGASAGSYEFLRVGTASMGGNFFPLGSAIAQTINEYLEGLNASAQATGGSAENCNFLQQGELELALVQSAALQEAASGTGAFEGRAIEELRGITAIYFMEFHILVGKNSGIDSVADLAGKRIAVGPMGSGFEINTNTLLAAYGIGPEDYEGIYGTAAEAQEYLTTGSADAHVYATGVGGAQVVDMMRSGNVKLIPIEPEMIEAIVEANPDLGQSAIPAGTYPGQDEELATVAGSAILATSSNISEEIIYEVTKTLFENIEYMESFHNLFTQTRPETATIGMPVPLHPGAEKYLKEVGAQ